MNPAKNFATTCLGIMLICSLAVQSAYAGVAGYAQFVMGNVQILGTTGQSRALQKGGAVNEGDTVISAKGASAQIKMQDGGLVAMRPDTRLKFDSFKFSGKEDGSERAIFSLIKGGFRSITGLIGRINKPSYRITTAVATIGIRGTDHETYVLTPDNSLASAAPAGTYNKVNVGVTSLTTEKGTILVMPNQMGFAGAADQMPELKPLNTDIFTVADKPTQTARKADQGREAVRETAPVDNTAEEGTVPEAGFALPAGESIDTDILQPITTQEGTDLSGGGEVLLAYMPKHLLIEIASPFFIGTRNYMAEPFNITYTGGAPNSFKANELDGSGSSSNSVIGGTPVTSAATSGSTGIQFGRWDSVTALESIFTTPLGSRQSPTTWMYGPQGYLDAAYTGTFPTPITGAMATTFTYSLDGSTAPHDRQSGQIGSLNSASITADFLNGLIDASLGLTVDNQVWSASALGLPLNGTQFFASASPGGGAANNLTISTGTQAGGPAPCTSCGGNLNGAFTGQNYAGAILSYHLWDNSNAGGDVSGQAALVRPASGPLGPIANDIPAPTPLYVIATDSGRDSGGIQLVDTLNNPAGSATISPGGVLTAYSWSGAQGGGYSSTTVTCSGAAGCTSMAASNATNAATPTGIFFGTWEAGSLTSAYGVNIGNASPHWISGPESGPLFLANALVGSKTFSFDGGMAANFMGAPGTVLGTTTLTVDFTRQVVGINLDLSVPDTLPSPTLHTWNATTPPGNEAVISAGMGLGGATFQASSYNGAGPGFLTVTVDAGTASPVAGSGNVSGQLTGMGFNGAILSYSLNAQLPSPSFTFEQVNGVAALASTASDAATPYHQVMMSATDPNSIISVPIMGFYANAPARMTEVAGNLTQFDMNFFKNGRDNTPAMTLDNGSSVLANAGKDPLTGISWGRWEGGNVNATDRITAVNTQTPLAGSLHWIAGPTETAATTLPVTGTYTYTHAGGTAPTDNLGGVGTLNSATLSADFSAQTVNIGVDVTVSAVNLVAAAANVPIIQRTGFVAESQLPPGIPAHLTVTCTGASCGTSTQGAIYGGFTGAGATGAMMTYGFENASATGTQVISGVAAFHR